MTRNVTVAALLLPPIMTVDFEVLHARKGKEEIKEGSCSKETSPGE
jgi:hypothetical protein